MTSLATAAHTKPDPLTAMAPGRKPHQLQGNQSEWKRLSGGLAVRISHFQDGNGSITGTLQEATKTIANRHSASLRECESVAKVIAALEKRDLEAAFFDATWDIHEPITIGVHIYFRTIGLKRKGNEIDIAAGVYCEDTCILPRRVRELVASRPAGSTFPTDLGLGEYFQKECFWILVSRDETPLTYLPAYLVAEVDPENKKMLKLMRQSSTDVGLGSDSAVLEVNHIQNLDLARTMCLSEVAAIDLPDTDANNFAIQWSSDGKLVVMSFSKGFSTVDGAVIIQAQVKSNGKLSGGEDLRVIVTSLLVAAEKEIRKRAWGEGTVPTAHIHVLKEPEVLAALTAMGVRQRTLGECVMKPTVMEFADMMQTAPRPLSAPYLPTAAFESGNRFQ